MKLFLVLAAAVAATSAVSYKDVFAEEWNLFKAEYNKEYEPIENSRRMEIFLQKKYKVAQHNLKYKNGEVSYEMEINEFSDLTYEEFAERYGLSKKVPIVEGDPFEAPSNFEAPESMNWVDEGAVSPVKSQGQCGSSCAFSAIGALETQKYLATNEMVTLSEQEIVDCSGRNGNLGCRGGHTTTAYEYILENGGINTDSSYPYEGKDGECRFDKDNIGASISGYTIVNRDEESLKEAVALNGTVSVIIEVLDSFISYKGGVYYDFFCYSGLGNHAALVVGYGTDPTTNKDYWLVKNSWGSKWGDNGYIKMARNMDNHCGIRNCPLIPKLK